MIIYVDDANDEVPVFTQQQYNRLGLKETAGIGTSVIVVRATDPDSGESRCEISMPSILGHRLHTLEPKRKKSLNMDFNFPLKMWACGLFTPVEFIALRKLLIY